MIGLDTNVLVRYLVQDEPIQAVKAARFVQQSLKSGETFFLNHIVLCELAWVLESAYGFPKNVLVDVLEKLLLTQQFAVEDRDVVWTALEHYRHGTADFSDYLIGEKNRRSGCSRTETFDRDLKAAALFDLL